jgi:anti-anti-sigma factor
MDISIQQDDRCLIITLSGPLNAATVSELEQVCLPRIQKGLESMVLDFTGVELMTSAGLRSLLCLGKPLTEIGSQLVICGMPAIVEEVFTLAGFDSLFPMFNSLDAWKEASTVNS